VGYNGAILRYGPEIEAPLSTRKPLGAGRRKPEATGFKELKGFDANGRWQGNW
jgi:hypothetical protein